MDTFHFRFKHTPIDIKGYHLSQVLKNYKLATCDEKGTLYVKQDSIFEFHAFSPYQDVDSNHYSIDHDHKLRYERLNFDFHELKANSFESINFERCHCKLLYCESKLLLCFQSNFFQKNNDDSKMQCIVYDLNRQKCYLRHFLGSKLILTDKCPIIKWKSRNGVVCAIVNGDLILYLIDLVTFVIKILFKSPNSFHKHKMIEIDNFTIVNDFCILKIRDWAYNNHRYVAIDINKAVGRLEQSTNHVYCVFEALARTTRGIKSSLTTIASNNKFITDFNHESRSNGSWYVNTIYLDINSTLSRLVTTKMTKIVIEKDQTKSLWKDFDKLECFYTNNYIFLICIYDELKKFNVYVSYFKSFGTSSGLNGEYKLLNVIGSGATSTVYNARFFEAQGNDQTRFAIKQQANTDCKNNVELKIYERLQNDSNVCGIACKLFDYFELNNFRYFVFEKLGVSLQHLLMEYKDHDYCLSLSQVLTLFDQLCIILYKLHSIGFTHNDIKPQNILIGNNANNVNKFYLIDFGVAKPYWDFTNNKHISINPENTTFDGTFRFSSYNHHCLQLNQSRRDDLESLIYLCIFCLTNKLPWIVSKNLILKEEIYIETRNIKEITPISVICKNIPIQFRQALEYVRKLKYDQEPDYKYLQNLFRELHLKSFKMKLNWKAYMQTQNSNNKWFIGTRIKQLQSSNDDDNNNNNNNDNNNSKNIISESQLKQQNKKMIDKYSNTKHKDANVMTMTNCQTHMSVHGLKTRFDYYIDSLTISSGVPTPMIIDDCKFKDDYGGIIVYRLTSKNNAGMSIMRRNVISGEIYMLPVTVCNKISDEYDRNHNDYLVGQIHGAVYYHYFGKNIHFDNLKRKPKRTIDNLEFIRGFSMYKNGTFGFRSGAFNKVGHKLCDDKYKELAKCEQSFVMFAIKNYWKNTSNVNYEFRQLVPNNINNKYEKVVEIDKTMDNVQTVPWYVGYKNIDDSNNETSNNATFYDRIQLSLHIISNILDYLTKSELIVLSLICHNSRLHLNEYSFNKSSCFLIIDVLNYLNNSSTFTLSICQLSSKEVERSICTQIYPQKINFVDMSFRFNKKKCFIIGNYYYDYLNILNTFYLHNINSKLNIFHQNCYQIVSMYGDENCDSITNIDNKLQSGETEWRWHRRDDIWYNYEKETSIKIENAFLTGVEFVDIRCQTFSMKINHQFRILFKDDSTQAPMHYTRTDFNCVKYFYQINCTTNFVRLVKRCVRSNVEIKNGCKRLMSRRRRLQYCDDYF